MPVYTRKNLSLTPSSLYDVETEDDNDYLLDPDQMYDILPQPYRMINKILTEVLDLAMTIVETKESPLFAEARKVCPPQFNESQILNVYNNATALGSSANGKYIFVGLPNGLAVLDASTQSSVYIWKHNGPEITSIKSYRIGPTYHLVMTQDDMGQVQLFLFGHKKLFFILAINENPPENSSKTLCQKWEASSGGEYAGFIFEHTSSKEVWFEVHSLPVKDWVTNLETIGIALKQQKKKEKSDGASTESNLSDLTIVEKPDSFRNVELALLEKLNITFSKPSLILKVKSPPGMLLPASTSSNIASAVQKVDTGDVLGVGLNHVLSAAHLDSMDAMFEYRHEDMIQYLPLEKEETAVSATFHFANASRLITFGLDENVPDTVPVSVVMWWSGSPHCYHYSLIKAEKSENPEISSEIVWPFTSNIACSSVSSCTTYLALGLANGNVVIWNRQLGLLKAVVNASHKSSIKSIRFLDPCLFPCNPPMTSPYLTSLATCLLVECSDGTQQLFDTHNGSQQIPKCIAEEPENDDDIQTLLQVIPGIPELMIYVKKNGNLYIKDIGTGANVCQIVPPPTHHIQTPWNPVFAFGDEGKILYLKCEGTGVNDDGVVKDISGICMFDLNSYPVLNKYRTQKLEKKVLNVFSTQEQRSNALLQERMHQQMLRKSLQQRRWGQFRSQLDIIQHVQKLPENSIKFSFNTHTC